MKGPLKGVARAQGKNRSCCSPRGVLAAGSCYPPWLEGARGGSVYWKHGRNTLASTTHTFTGGSWSLPALHPAERKPEERGDLLRSSALLWCSLVVEETGSSKLPSEVRAGRRRLEPGHGVPSPSPRGIQARRWLSCPCLPGARLPLEELEHLLVFPVYPVSPFTP